MNPILSTPGTRPAQPEPCRSRDLAVVVNSYNRRELLRRALDSLFSALNPIPSEVVVVDDGSNDGSAELVRAYMRDGHHPGLALIEPPSRVGFAGGVNLGLRSTRAPYVCLFETDNVALDSGMWRAVEHLRTHAAVAAIGFNVLRCDGTQAPSGQAFPRPLAFALGQQLTQSLGLEREPTGPRQEVVYTSPIVVSRAAVDAVGAMDAEVFPFCDSDIDWCHRLVDAGYELHVLRSVSVVHDQGGVKSEFSHRRTFDFHRARLAYFRRHRPDAIWWLKPALLARHVGEMATLVAQSLLGMGGARDRLRTRVALMRAWASDYQEPDRSPRKDATK